MGTYLLVHGAWHSAAHWNKVAEALTERGHRVHALDLPGSGLDADLPGSYLRNDFDAFASEPSPAGGIHLAHKSAALVGDPMTSGAMRLNPRSADPEYVENGRLALYGDVPTEQYLRFASYCNPDLPLAVAFDDARGTPERWGTVPRTFIRTTEDRTVPLALQDRMIAEADALTPGNRFEVRSLPSSHSPFASMPDRLAELLAAA
jgi:hypothetical protein